VSGKSKIEWTDATWNPVRGCTKISPGCKNCYAETFAERWRGIPGHPYEQGFDLRLVPEKLEEPLRWKKPRKIFVNSMSDLFQDGVPFEFIAQCFDVMARAHWHTFQILTKRADRMREFVEWWLTTENGRDWFDGLPKHIWFGVSVENQEWANKRIPELLRIPAAVRFISYEPALSEVSLPAVCRSMNGPCWCGMHISTTDFSPIDKSKCPIDLVIVGGESGPWARPFDVKWARHMRQQAYEMHFALFVKQMGSLPIVAACRQNHFEWGEANFSEYSATHWRIKLKDRKGGDMNEWADDLRVRQLPK